MLVCRHWREVGRMAASLWRVADIESDARWLQLVLDRSQGAALELYFHSPPTAISSIPLLTQHSHRIRKLLLPPIKGSDLPALATLLLLEMPILDEFCIWVDDYTGSPHVDPTILQFCASRFPNLRQLRVSHITFQWNPSAVANLRFLHIHKCHSLDPTLSFDQFLDALASCAELEELRLHQFISTINNSVSVGYDREISLPQLRKLVVGDVPALTVLFLSTIALPISIELRVVGYINSLVLDDEFHLFRLLLPTDRARLLILRSVTKVEFHGYDESFYASGALPSGGSIKLVLRSHLDDVDFELYTERGITEVADIFHHSPVTDLHVNCAPDTVDDPEVWAILLASFSRVRNLYVLPGQIMRPIWHALGGRSYLMHPSANHKHQ